MSFMSEEMVENRREGLDENENLNQSRAEQFEELLEEYEYDRPKRGQIVEGEVIRVYEDMILVDIGAKRDAVIPRNDLSNFSNEYLDNISKGDKVPVFVDRAATGDDELLVSLEKGLMQEDWDRVKEYKEDDTVTELEIVGYNKGGVLVQFGRLEGFIPNSHITEIRRGVSRQERDQTKANMIGQKLECKVLEVDQRQSRLLFSERDAKQERRDRRLQELEKGQVVTGKVVNIVDFGAFIDLTGVDGLIHISELDWERIDHPSEVVDLGEDVEVEVIDVDAERERVSLSRKARLPSPWQRVSEKYNPGDLVEGTVTNVRDFGAFVEIPEGVVGLVHVSEIGFGGSGNPRELVKRGDTVLCRVMDIEPEKERMSLSMQRVTYDEQISWMVDNVEEAESRGEVSQFAAAMTDAVKEEATGPLPSELVEEIGEAVETEVEESELPEAEAVEAEVEEGEAEPEETMESDAESAEAEMEAEETPQAEVAEAEVDVETEAETTVEAEAVKAEEEVEEQETPEAEAAEAQIEYEAVAEPEAAEVEVESEAEAVKAEEEVEEQETPEDEAAEAEAAEVEAESEAETASEAEAEGEEVPEAEAEESEEEPEEEETAS